MLKGQHRNRFEKTIERLLYDVESMRADQAAVYAIGPAICHQFMHQARAAFESDRLVRLIRLLEKSTRVSSLWYLHRCEPVLVERALVDSGLNIGKVERLSGRVKLVRDQVFVHTDKDAVSDPEAVYKHSGIVMSDLAEFVEALWLALNALYASAFQKPYPQRPTTAALRSLFERELHGIRENHWRRTRWRAFDPGFARQAAGSTGGQPQWSKLTTELRVHNPTPPMPRPARRPLQHNDNSEDADWPSKRLGGAESARAPDGSDFWEKVMRAIACAILFIGWTLLLLDYGHHAEQTDVWGIVVFVVWLGLLCCTGVLAIAGL
jgi:hypothetical protein